MPANTSEGALVMVIYGINPGSTVDVTIDAAQLEKGAFATSYIPTTTTTVTRNADVVTVPTTGWNASAGTIAMVNGPALNDGVRGGTKFLWRGTNATLDALALVRDQYANEGFLSASGGTSGGASTGEVVSAFAYAVGQNVIGSVNGVVVTPSGSSYVAPVGLYATASIATGSNWQQMFNGPIQRLTVYNSALSSGNVSTVTNAVKDGP